MGLFSFGLGVFDARDRTQDIAHAQQALYPQDPSQLQGLLCCDPAVGTLTVH